MDYKLRTGDLIKDVTTAPGMMTPRQAQLRARTASRASTRSGASSTECGARERHRPETPAARTRRRSAPAMTIGYYPGCSLHGTAREFDESLRAVLAALRHRDRRDRRLVVLRRHLGARHQPPARRRAAGAQPGARRGAGPDSVLAPCAACYNRLAAARHAIAADDGMAERIARHPRPPVREHGRRAQRRRAAARRRRRRSKSAPPPPDAHPLDGLKVACYYGCLLVRPPEVAGFDDPEAPDLDGGGRRAPAAPTPSTGTCRSSAAAAPSRLPHRARSCAWAAPSSTTRARRRRGDRRRLPDVPLQPRLPAEGDAARGEEPLPVLFLTQLVGLALGLRPPRSAWSATSSTPSPSRTAGRAGGGARRGRGSQAEAAAKAAAAPQARAGRPPPGGARARRRRDATGSSTDGDA